MAPGSMKQLEFLVLIQDPWWIQISVPASFILHWGFHLVRHLQPFSRLSCSEAKKKKIREMDLKAKTSDILIICMNSLNQTPGMCNLFNIPVTVHRIKNVSQWHLGASLWGEPLTACLPGESYAGSLSELISARVTCAQAHLHYHKITSLTPDAYHVPQAFNEQELALFVICCPPHLQDFCNFKIIKI